MTGHSDGPRLRVGGLSLVEVLVAITILAIISAAVVGLLPSIVRTSRAASNDLIDTQTMQTVLERIAGEWQDSSAYAAQTIGEDAIGVFIAEQLAASDCTGAVSQPAVSRTLVVITCPASGGLPERSLRREYAEPVADDG